jgi:hypothetical protein
MMIPVQDDASGPMTIASSRKTTMTVDQQHIDPLQGIVDHRGDDHREGDREQEHGGNERYGTFAQSLLSQLLVDLGEGCRYQAIDHYRRCISQGISLSR